MEVLILGLEFQDSRISATSRLRGRPRRSVASMDRCIMGGPLVSEARETLVPFGPLFSRPVASDIDERGRAGRPVGHQHLGPILGCQRNAN